MFKRIIAGIAFVFGVATIAAAPADAQVPPVVDAGDTVVLPGNVRRQLGTALDQGPAAVSLPMERMILSLRIGPGKRAALDALLADLHDPHSTNFHRWLTPDEFGQRFGPAPAEIRAITDWLTSEGFVVEEVAGGRTWINFSGDVSRVQRAFRTQIRNYFADGAIRYANAQNPSIPRALADIVAGVVSLHNFPRKSMHVGARRVPQGKALADYTSGSGNHYLSPGDFATIYNVNPLYAAGVDGSGQTIAIVGRTHPPASNWAAFRSLMALPPNPPQVVINGTDPGDVSDDEDVEADLDVEWSGAVAKNATIKFVTSRSTFTTDGVDLSAQYIVNNNLAAVMSTSFGSCEADMSTSENNFYANLWAQAAAQGITSFVASGDSGASGCDGGSAASGSGLGVNGLASTPSNVAVGGTQFDEGSGSFWNPTNGTGYTSAKSYIPEMAWNESGTVAGGSGLWATGGGSSLRYGKPAWQVAPGVPADGKRDIPDISLSAAGHDGYLVQTLGTLYSVGGTSASSPAAAGLMALIVQQTGQRQGNANIRFYQLGNAQYGMGGAVVFHDTTAGNNSVPGVAGYATAAGYDLSTGLGSVDANALATHWVNSSAPGAPTIGTATAGDKTATVTFGVAVDHGSPITTYTATSFPGGISGGCTAPCASINVAGLANGTAYTFTVAATNAFGRGPPSSASNSVTPSAPPVVATSGAAGIMAASATLTGTVTSNGASTTVTFQYGLTTGYVSGVTATQSPLAANAAGAPVSAVVSGLACNTLYHFRVVAASSAGTTNGGDTTFTTAACPPSVTTNGATAIAATGATQNGTVSSNGASTTVTFQYGPTTAYGSSASAAQSPLSASAVGAPVSAAIAGLACNKLYHFRVVAANSAGTTNGGDTTFTTAACTPSVSTNAATAIAAMGATQNGTVSSNGASTTVTFQYGPTTTYGSSVAAAQSPLSASAFGLPVSAATAGLACNTLYHFRVIAANSVGIATGADMTFTTAACAPTVATAAASAIVGVGAALNATASSNGASTTVGFQYGLTTGYGSSVSAAPSPLAAGASAVAVSAAITGLACNTTYHFRAVGTNSAGATAGADMTFTSAACARLDAARSGGPGNISSDPPGIGCGPVCSTSLAPGTNVTLIATPDAGAVFTGWGGGGCSGTFLCTLTMSADRSVTATFTGIGAGSPGSNEWVQKSYVAYYGRPADPPGLAYWANRLDSAGGSLASIIAAFGTSDEFNLRYGNLSNGALIDTLYQQLLGRAPDPAGKQYYLDQLNAGRTTLQTITLDLLGGATGADALTVANRLDVANHYTGKVAQGCPYGSALTGVASLSPVTSDAAMVWSAKLATESRCAA